VDDVVSQLLKTPRRASVDAHRIILSLSRNARKRPQVVTTNFDLLFECADKSLQVHVPPALPDLAIVEPMILFETVGEASESWQFRTRLKVTRRTLASGTRWALGPIGPTTPRHGVHRSLT
jgi:hypothetical protein